MRRLVLLIEACAWPVMAVFLLAMAVVIAIVGVVRSVL